MPLELNLFSDNFPAQKKLPLQSNQNNSVKNQDMTPYTLVTPYTLAILIPVARAHHQVFDAKSLQLTMQHVAEATRLVAGNHTAGQTALLLYPDQKLGRTKPLGTLGCLLVDLTNDHVLFLVDIDSKLDDFRCRFSLFIR